MAKKLGMGLSALLGGGDDDFSDLDHTEAGKSVAITNLYPGQYQPRHAFDDESLRDLAESIRAKGVLQPLLVRPHPTEDGAFEIIAGERRWRAAQLAQIHDVPVIVRDFNDRETLEVALIENLQRQDLSPLEEADGYRRLMGEFSHTQEVLAKSLGKSRSHVANMLRLLTLPEPIKAMLDDGRLSVGHARALVGAEHAVPLAQEVVKKGLNVRQTEKLVKGNLPPKSATVSSTGAGKTIKDADTLALENDLENLLGLKVDIKDRDGRGTLMIYYETLEQLDGVLARLTPEAPRRS